jgi:hypothetical protein
MSKNGFLDPIINYISSHLCHILQLVITSLFNENDQVVTTTNCIPSANHTWHLQIASSMTIIIIITIMEGASNDLDLIFKILININLLINSLLPHGWARKLRSKC